ncbi:glycoside hydrolase family 97 catalytic domain-containing protein [Niveispirillum sp. KHB5.9]|uniref:glycoside hydrolase family 97 protein n=1 Tax=Niveispirillum sp. KHB5.9 TaxID=3400269 RepID=UPI003A8787A2
MNNPTRRGVLAGAVALPIVATGPTLAQPATHAVTSPDGKLRLTLDPSGPRWSATYRGKVILAPSPLALRLADGQLLGPDAAFITASTRTITGTWAPPYGIRSECTEACGELMMELRDNARNIRFALVARAYDAGIAIRFRLLDAPGNSLALSGEATEFRLPTDAVLYVSRDEGEYQRTVQNLITPVPHPDLTESCDQEVLADTPITAQLADGTCLLISESDRLHYPRTMLRSGNAGIVTHLMRFPGRATGYSGPGTTPPEDSFTLPVPFDTPWRVIMAGPDAKGLIERQDLIATLATPNILGDVSWIKPGRAVRIREYTTQAGLDTVDFAARRKLDFVEWDAHWYGDGTDPSDATYSIPAIDIRRVIDYARSKGLGMILYVDRVPAMRQLDAIVKTYQSWGVAGIKFGFIWEGRQSDVDFIHNLVKVCGEHKLLVNLHDNLRPAGLERTLPNYVALEGVRGNEQFPTSEHNCTLPFTRALSGPIDYTICFANPKNQTTNAHQLALAAIYYNPQTFLYWYDKPDKYAGRDWPELAFFDECPTTWTDVRALSGTIGEHAVVARRARNGRWFLGAITNGMGRTLTIDLGFLGDGKWQVRRFADGAPAAPVNRTRVTVTTEIVKAGARLEMVLSPHGGQAMIFERT